MVWAGRLNGRLAINLVNTAGPHADQKKPLHDSIPVVGPLDLTIRATTKPARITLEPGAQPLTFTWRNGEARVTVPRLEIHSVVMVQ